jgi:hypothetical protein
MRKYIRAHKHRRRARLINMLGGTCVRCGTTEDLEFDHIDPATKRFAICADLTRAWSELLAEVAKCQLLCRPCHIAKGAEDRPEVPHGLYRHEYWRCRRDVCRGANSVASARKRRLYPRRLAPAASDPYPDPARSGVAQSAERPAVNRTVASSSLASRANQWVSVTKRSSAMMTERLTCPNRAPLVLVTRTLPDALPIELRGIAGDDCGRDGVLAPSPRAQG